MPIPFRLQRIARHSHDGIPALRPISQQPPPPVPEAPWPGGEGHEMGANKQLRLRILYVTARFPPLVGGTELAAFQTARLVAAAGHQVTVLTTDPTASLPVRDTMEGFDIWRVRAWPADRDYYFAPEILQRIKAGEWDIVHCQGVHTFVAPLTMLAAQRAGLPYVVSFHSGAHSSRVRTALRGVQWALLRPLLARASRLVAVSRFEADYFQRQLRLPQDSFEVIQSGSQLPRVEVPAPPLTDSPLIVSVGRLERCKGHHRIIAAMPRIVESYPHVRLRILGSGAYEPALRQLAQEMGVSDRVEIGAIPLEDRDAMARALAGANLLVLLSEYESQGNSVYEALSLGRPALVTDTSALSDLVVRGLVRGTPIGSSEYEIATAVLDQLRQPLFPDLALLPTWEICCDRHLGVYRSVLQGVQRAA